MKRLLRIAGREYAAYVRTIGFWLSMGLMPVGLILAVFASSQTNSVAPVPTVAMLDQTGRAYAERIEPALAERHGPSTRPVAVVEHPASLGADPAGALRGLVGGDAELADGRRLDVAAIIRPEGEGVAVDAWSRNPADRSVENAISNALSDLMRQDRLAKAGVDAKTLAAIDALQPHLTSYSPKAAGGRVDDRERLQMAIGLAMGLLLWMVVLTGAGILLNSVIEEKSSRILEVLLTSASVPEIMGGKILGVAAVTSTVLGVWLTIGLAILLKVDAGIVKTLVEVMLSKGLIIYFAVYFIGGYLMYATLFTTIGAFCETSREAQTLLGPMMILLSVPLVFMNQAMLHPDAPLVQALSWFPPFTPFMMAARAASGPPWWQVVGSGALMFALTGLELWVAGRAFRAGALSNSRFEPRHFFASLAGRAE
ncbi:ABC transporter permease [Phenylobacterium montanum]|uniref:ABC transporter permease n=1 Tax=Phenylobacterium montanum TaxID=2823693 RepID=A0A975FX59_9CAUL|nr:ABC transporter permease [Caulobacter sp. S6]QUD87050.1 ABC transporter permease [Caulobacter sp. S6]